MIQQDGVTLKFLVGHKNQPRSRSSDRRREVVHSLGGLTGSPSSSTTWLLLHEDDVELQSHSCWSSEASRSIYHVVVEGLGEAVFGATTTLREALLLLQEWLVGLGRPACRRP